MPVEHVAEIRGGKLPPPQADRLEWMSAQLDALRTQYAGKWVVVTDEGVVASAADLGELLSLIETQGVSDPFVTQIPAEPMIWNTAYAHK